MTMVAVTPALSLWGVRSPVLVVSLLVAGVIAPGQEPPASLEGRVIDRIEFDPAEQPLPIAELERALPFRVGSVLKSADVRAAIQRLYQTGRFSDISIEGTPGPGDAGVTVRITTSNTYFVSGVTIDGVAEPPTKGQLTTAAKLELGAPFDPGELQQATENIEERLRANGLYQSKVTVSVDRRPETEEVRIHFVVDSEDRAHFDGATLTGDFKKSPESILNDTHWRRGFGPLRFPGWRTVTENRLQTGSIGCSRTFNAEIICRRK